MAEPLIIVVLNQIQMTINRERDTKNNTVFLQDVATVSPQFTVFDSITLNTIRMAI